ncbi:hypothetical protein EKL30_00280 [Candidimonas sp. SYP-B2681]|uniref:hypothetical protein n=1 Tax=Candidimonas sp. SYP-B2681 TaxID=2497686 RepID=UPI000F87031F|nr:hypothetical protein [Candidimonas sp. SYP-B2681]RTZ47487.1 hypothetical protein EKL30_00280 [Candidimonas sp. SYP-B2681]
MASENFSITPDTVHQLKGLLAEIASMASTVSELASDLIMHGKLEKSAGAVSIDIIAKNMGLMADLGTNKLGGGEGFKGSTAEDWMLS